MREQDGHVQSLAIVACAIYIAYRLGRVHALESALNLVRAYKCGRNSALVAEKHGQP